MSTQGRPSKLNPEIVDKLYTVLANHGSVEQACDVAGIGLTSFATWLRKGEAGKKGYKEFLDKMREARGLSQTSLVKKIADDPSWQSKAWLLERRHPKAWGRKDRIEHTGRDGGPIKSEGTPPAINITLTGITDNPYAPEEQNEPPPQIEKPKPKVEEVDLSEDW